MDVLDQKKLILKKIAHTKMVSQHNRGVYGVGWMRKKEGGSYKNYLLLKKEGNIHRSQDKLGSRTKYQLKDPGVM